MKLLVIGELNGHIARASQIALERNVQVVAVADEAKGLDVLRKGSGCDLCMIEDNFDIEGFMQALRSERMAIPVIACGLGKDPGKAELAIKAGAKDYLPLPPDADLIFAVIEAVTEESHHLIYNDPKMQAVLTMADKIAPSDASVLITGASGTGKEVMARYIHEKSLRGKKPFVALNCAAIPENLLESELFGHEKGAFTGALARRIGKFEEADGGTLLLDEISEMDVRLQAKLLRVLQEREIDRLGGRAPVKVDVRILATSNRDMARAVKDGSFREDLFFRLNVVTIDLPRLSERPEDINVLATHFALEYAEMNRKKANTLTGETLKKLQAHPWPGNVRELENTIHRAVLLAESAQITPEAILFTPGTETPEMAKLEDVEKAHILEAVRQYQGDDGRAAKILGISIRLLREKLADYDKKGTTEAMPQMDGNASI